MKLLNFILDHNYRAQLNADGSVSFWIPFVNMNTKERGEDMVTVRTLREARIEMGY